jgi:hypothetical protein
LQAVAESGELGAFRGLLERSGITVKELAQQYDELTNPHSP